MKLTEMNINNIFLISMISYFSETKKEKLGN